jgi:hypothetical protein
MMSIKDIFEYIKESDDKSCILYIPDTDLLSDYYFDYFMCEEVNSDDNYNYHDDYYERD